MLSTTLQTDMTLYLPCRRTCRARGAPCCGRPTASRAPVRAPTGTPETALPTPSASPSTSRASSSPASASSAAAGSTTTTSSCSTMCVSILILVGRVRFSCPAHPAHSIFVNVPCAHRPLELEFAGNAPRVPHLSSWGTWAVIQLQNMVKTATPTPFLSVWSRRVLPHA